MQTNGEISLYIHVPFCTKKCDYCHFYVIPNTPLLQKVWWDAIQIEKDLVFPKLKDKKLVSLYFGGGTPALAGPQIISEIISWCKNYFGPIEEITLEANPENVTTSLMRDFLDAGVNRISLGVQTFDEEQLLLLGRTHSAKKSHQAIFDVAQAGCSNISIDLMYDLPKQSIASWKRSLRELESLPIQHMSLYNLTIEPHTLFHKYTDKITPLLPPEEESLAMHRLALDYLRELGWEQYEISAFTKEQKRSIHNSGYWKGRAFWGMGPSAFSYWDGVRFRNQMHIQRYSEALKKGLSPVDFWDPLSPEDRRKELFVLRLRLMEGVEIPTFEKMHGPLSSETKHSLEQLEKKGLIEDASHHPKLSYQGLLFYDLVATELI